MKPGLVSISFRSLPWEKTLDLAVQADLEGIEWGGDVHVPHGKTKLAEIVGEATRSRGLSVAAYGSYYRLGEESPSFCAVLDTAEALGTSLIRVWAGHKGSAECSESDWARLIDDGLRITEAASSRSVRVTFEYHGHTLTDTELSCARLLNAVPRAESYWQPPVDMVTEDCLSGLHRIGNRLAGVHVFSWAGTDRLPLIARESDWKIFLREAGRQSAEWALLEFVRNDDPGQLVRDAATLRTWLVSSAFPLSSGPLSHS
jgi:hypothetical protein